MLLSKMSYYQKNLFITLHKATKTSYLLKKKKVLHITKEFNFKIAVT